VYVGEGRQERGGGGTRPPPGGAGENVNLAAGGENH